MLDLFGHIRQPDDVRDWFASRIRQMVRNTQDEDRAHAEDLQRQLPRLRTQRDQLLNLRLNDEIETSTFAKKDQELRDRQSRVELQIEAASRGHDEKGEHALELFELLQNLQERWLTADFAAKRTVLDLICLNFRLDGASLVPTMRKPFDVLIEGLELVKNRDDRIRTCDLCVPNTALCQTELHPGPISPILGVGGGGRG